MSLFDETVPLYQEPGYQEPPYQEPGYQEPPYQEPGYQEPPYQEPGYQEPPYQSRGYQETLYQAPSGEEPSYRTNPVYPSYEKPVAAQQGREKKKKKGGASTVLILVLSIVAVALTCALVVLCIHTFGGKKPDEEKVAEREERASTDYEESSEETESETALRETESLPPSVETVPPSSAPQTFPLPETVEAVSEYILPNSNSTYLTEADLATLTKEELRLARNEIYARHGRKFKDSGLNDYFMGKSWYTPLVEADRFNENVFNDYEAANRKLIADYEKKMGY